MPKPLAILTLGLSLMGCEGISNLLPKEPIPTGATTADLVIHAGGVGYKYICQIDNATKALTNCTEVK